MVIGCCIDRLSWQGLSEPGPIDGHRHLRFDRSTSDWYWSPFYYSVVITPPSKYGGDLAPTEGWSHGSQNCLHDMRIVGDTELIRNG